MKYWDSSAMLPLLISEKLSPEIKNRLRADPDMVAWWGTMAECASALHRKEREGALSQPSLTQGMRRLKDLRSSWIEVEPGEKVREAALRLLRVHPLRAADSLQLAAALIANEQQTDAMEFVCLDERLRSAAEREGFSTIP